MEKPLVTYAQRVLLVVFGGLALLAYPYMAHLQSKSDDMRVYEQRQWYKKIMVAGTVLFVGGAISILLVLFVWHSPWWHQFRIWGLVYLVVGFTSWVRLLRQDLPLLSA